MSTPLRGENPEPSTEAGAGEAADDPIVINIPGVTEEPVVVAPPEGDAAERAAALAERAEQARRTPAPAISPEQFAYEEALRDRQRRRAALAAKAAEAQQRLDEAKGKFLLYQRQVESNLIDIESRRSEILLGRIYKAVREVARLEGVSVVVDKSQILYGQGSVDLTDKVIKRLEGSTP
jgi:Skp family chaperone for outer membrane proteins